MAESVITSYFPSQIASDEEKMSMDYGTSVGRAIEREWQDSNGGRGRFQSNQNTFHNLRLYARGEQGVQKYKDELSINGDLSYLNLDWKPVPIIPKFVDIVFQIDLLTLKHIRKILMALKNVLNTWSLYCGICKLKN